MAVLFRNLSGADRAEIISKLRDRGFLPNDALKDIVMAQDRSEFKQAIQNATNQVSEGELEDFFDALQELIRDSSIENFISEEIDTEDFIESYF